MARIDELRTEFCERHKDAHELVYNKLTGHPMYAVYYSYDYMADAEAIRFFTAVREAEQREAPHGTGE